MDLVYKEKEHKLNRSTEERSGLPERTGGALTIESPQGSLDIQTDRERPGWDLVEPSASGFLAGAFHARAATFRNDEELLSFTNVILFQPVPDNISRENRNLLLHFSEHIANEMISFDGFHNGWRHLVLPLALTDDLVMNAVLATAAAHQRLNQLSNNKLQTNMYTLWHPKSSQLYARAIRGLQQRQELIHSNQSSKYSILVTILVLLTAVMVTGCSDFPVLFRMLESAVAAMGGTQGIGDGELTDFIMRQVHKMRVYAAPLLCEQTGVEIISSQRQTAQLFDCLNYSTREYPDQAWVLSNVSEVVDQARDIYLHQVFLDPENSSSLDTAAGISSIRRVQRFKESLEAFPLDSPGQKVLVWATFVAASDCKLEEHKVFFEGVLMRHFARNLEKEARGEMDLFVA
ncbi:hypothetical protein QQX98_000063 [Neonectria punicea]|uniref:Uncharacterized protein n=1 Tax=Neonectria punicea TaxID=979145 RepID=A0ABR1HWG1_9HYPO